MILEGFDGLVMAENQWLLTLMDRLAEPGIDDVIRMEGSPHLADWLVARYRWSRFRARELVRVMGTLQSLPQIRGVFAAGVIGWDQLRAVTVFATPDRDPEWAGRIVGLTPSQITELYADLGDPVAEETASSDRSVQHWYEETRPVFRMDVTLPDADGAVVETALVRAANKFRMDPETEMVAMGDTSMADALVEMASAYLADDSDHDRATVLITADIQSIVDGGTGMINDSRPISNPMLQRLLCDARLQLAIRDPQTGCGRGWTHHKVDPSMACTNHSCTRPPMPLPQV